MIAADWRTRATEYVTPDGSATAICPTADDIAVAKLCAWRDKDRDWLRDALGAGIISAERLETLWGLELPPDAPRAAERLRRLHTLMPLGA